VKLVAGFHHEVTSDGQMLLVFSLRSRPGGTDVAALAQRMGGGGHRAAAGFGRAVTLDSPNPLATLKGLVESSEVSA